ncbi:MAG: hypothetical protein MK212_20290 [Saprospiraceae bacterium]|nr:hypothetical protein [Saprospiraceae bacterium]
MHSNTGNSKAFQVIQTMSKEEKRYFKLLVQGIGRKESSHLRLFDFLCKQKRYDKQVVKKALPDIKSIGNTDRYLYQLLLKSLRTYPSKSTIEITIIDKFKDLQILYNRQLYEMAKAEFLEVKRLIKLYDKLVYLPQLYKWQTKLEIANGRFSETDFEAFKKECHIDSQKIQNYLQYMLVATEVALLSRKSAGNQEVQQHLDHLMKQDWLREIKYCQSFSAKLIFLELQSIYYSTHQIEKSLASCHAIISAIQSKSIEVQEHRHVLYSIMVANAAYFSIYIKQWEKVEHYLSLLQELPKHYITPRIKLVEYYVRLTLNISQGAVHKTQELINEGKSFVSEYIGKLPLADIVVWKYYVASAFFLKEDYDEALKYTETLIHPTVDDGLNYAARILKLIILFELECYEILDSFLRSNYRFFKKNTDSGSFELILLSFLKQLRKFPSNDLRYRNTIIQAKQKIENYYSQNPFWHAYLPYCFDYLTWFDSKIMDISFALALQRKYKKGNN